ncbi:MAG: hypothetical protein R3E68_22870 [Burkholderiaceae bacterium]
MMNGGRVRVMNGLLLVVAGDTWISHVLHPVPVLGSLEAQAVHLGFVFALLFTMQPAVRAVTRALFGIWCWRCWSAAATIYVFVNVQYLGGGFRFPATLDVVIGVALIRW